MYPELPRRTSNPQRWSKPCRRRSPGSTRSSIGEGRRRPCKAQGMRRHVRNFIPRATLSEAHYHASWSAPRPVAFTAKKNSPRASPNHPRPINPVKPLETVRTNITRCAYLAFRRVSRTPFGGKSTSASGPTQAFCRGRRILGDTRRIFRSDGKILFVSSLRCGMVIAAMGCRWRAPRGTLGRTGKFN